MEPKLITSMYSRAVGALLLAFVVALLLASSMPPAMAAYRGNATYIDYQPEQDDWLWDSSKHCSNLDSNYPQPFRQRYRWTEFCGDCGAYTGECGCHRCLQVTNTATSDDASVTVRIIDICDKNNDDDPVVLWMDKAAFDQIDTDGQGGALGGAGDAQLKVNYEITDCEDPE